MAFELQIMILILSCFFFPTDCKVIKQASTNLTHKKCCITEYGPVQPLSFEQIVRKQAKKSFSSVIDAGADLSKLKEEFTNEQKSLKEHLKKAQEMTGKLKKNIKAAIEDVISSLNGVMKAAKEKFAVIKGAAKKLGDLEEEVGSSETRAKALDVRAKISKRPNETETKLEKDILSENRVIATLDAARLIAQSAAEKKENEKEKKSRKLIQEAKAIEDAMTTAEKNLDTEAKTELKDESIAKQKIKEALAHNKKAVKGAGRFLKNLEDKIKKFQNDIKTLII